MSRAVEAKPADDRLLQKYQQYAHDRRAKGESLREPVVIHVPSAEFRRALIEAHNLLLPREFELNDSSGRIIIRRADA